jgi:tetratricopeptide (TPR) repeat protein
MQPTTRFASPLPFLRLLAAVLATTAIILPTPGRADSLGLAGPEGDYATCVYKEGAKAITACTRTIALKQYGNSDLAILYLSRAVEHYRNDNNDAAIADADAAILLNPNSDACYGVRGLSRYEKGDYDRAIADFNEGVRLNPADSMYYEQLGRSWLAKGDVARALADFDIRIARAPQEASGFFNRALAWKKVNDRNRALADLDTAISLDPSNTLAINERTRLLDTRSDASGATTTR